MTIILGIDPGSRVTGYGVIKTTGNQHEYVTSGCLVIQDLPLSQRLEQIYRGIANVIAEFHPEEAAIEEVFMQKSAGSALKLGQARGAAMVSAAMTGLSVAEYSARQVKLAVVGYGAAEKSQVQHMVKTILNISAVLAADAADALAIAIAHAHSRGGLAILAGTTRRRRGRSR